MYNYRIAAAGGKAVCDIRTTKVEVAKIGKQ